MVGRPELGHAGEGAGQLLQAVVEEVENLEVLEGGEGGRQVRDLVVGEGQPADVLHAPQAGHVRLQRHQRLNVKNQVHFRVADPHSFHPDPDPAF
jgi:hypothetical protein